MHDSARSRGTKGPDVETVRRDPTSTGGKFEKYTNKGTLNDTYKTRIKVQERCHKRLQQSGLNWPAMLDVESF